MTYYFVSTTGDDGNSGTQDLPFRTGQRGINAMVPGDTLFFRGGTWYGLDIGPNGFMHATANGSAGARFTISGFENEPVVLDGLNIYPTLSYSYWALVNLGTYDRIGAAYWTIQKMTVQNSFFLGVVLRGIFNECLDVKANLNYESGIFSTNNDGRIENCDCWWNAKNHEYYGWRDITRFGGGSYYWASGLSAARYPVRTLIKNCRVWNNWGEGLSSFESDNTTIEDCVIYDNQLNHYISDTRWCLSHRNLIYCTPGNVCDAVWQGGIQMQDELGAVIRSTGNVVVNNLVLGCKPNLVFWWYLQGLTYMTIANNTFVNSRANPANANIYINGSPHTESVFKNNISLQEDSLACFYDNAGVSGITFSNNNWSKAVPVEAQGPGDVVGDPLLAKTGPIGPGTLLADYFKILSGSPCINKGISLAQVIEDYWRTLREAYPDIGAHEYKSPTNRIVWVA